MAVYRDIHDTPTALWKLLHIIPGQQQVNGSQVEPPCISSDQERLIDNELWRWIGSSATQNQGRDGNMAIQEEQLLFLATTERAFPFTWDSS